ncbi:MAG: ABC transporter [Acidobacteria bacterium]|nr:ABC transporter [Acidobacteriota bacterium]
MSNILAIAQKEIKSYFVSPIAYALLGIYALICGWFSLIAIANFIEMSQMQQGAADLNGYVIAPVIANAGVLSLFLAPMITMRLFAEEKRMGTIELLITSPITDLEIILGKWLGAMGMYCSMLLIKLLCLSFVFIFGNPDYRPLLTAYLGMFLQGGALLSIGMFVSNTTRNQIVAGTVMFGLSLLMWTFDWATTFKSDGWAKVISYLSLTSHFNSFSRGVLDSKDAIYFISVIVLGMFLTARSLESLRWRS